MREFSIFNYSCVLNSQRPFSTCLLKTKIKDIYIKGLYFADHGYPTCTVLTFILYGSLTFQLITANDLSLSLVIALYCKIECFICFPLELLASKGENTILACD